MNDVSEPLGLEPPDSADVGSAPLSESELSALAGDQPVAVIEHGGVRFTLLGTAHVSKSSAETVRVMIDSGHFDAVAVELDAGRYSALTDSESWSKMDLFKVIRQGKAAMLAVNLALSAFQQRLADQFGIEPGAEMRAAIAAADERKLPLLLIDRDIGVTLRRVYGNIGFWRRLTLLAGLLTSVFGNEKIDEEEIERLKEGDILESTFTEFAERSEQMFVPLITERDQYMVAKLLQQTRAGGPSPRHREVLVVIGAGHLKGISAGLRGDGTVPGLSPGEDGSGSASSSTSASLAGSAAAFDPGTSITRLERLKPPSRFVKLLPWLLVAVIVAGFVIGFSRGSALGFTLLSQWVIINATMAGLGAILALAHPITIVVSAVMAPLTSLYPLMGVGPLAAFTELWFRRPSVGDFESLKRDVTSWRGWWRNRAARALLVFVLTTIGSASATYLAGFRIFGSLLG